MKMTGKLLCLVIAVCCLVNPSQGDDKKEKFKILGLFPHTGKSHFLFFLPLLKELAHRGHELTVISHFPREKKYPNYKDISLDNTSTVANANNLDLNIFDYSFRFIFQSNMLQNLAESACSKTLRNPSVIELIKSDQKFDLIIVEVFNTDCMLGFVHKFKAPFIGLSSHSILAWFNDRVSNPDNPSYIPTVFLQLAPEMSFFQRVLNTLVVIIEKIQYKVFIQRPTQIMIEKAFGPGVPPLEEIANNMSALLVNTHFSIHGSRPYSQCVIEVGGLHIRDSKPLPKDIKDYLDSSKEGVLIFSWGSLLNAASLTKERLDTILKVLGSLKENVIWKYKDEELPNKPKNVMVREWLPQFDILSHPNVKGFLTHGGLLGLSEGIHVGVPMVIVPMFGDQFHNAAAAASRGVAIVLQYEDINEDSLRDALNEILNNPSYRKNVEAVSKAYRDRPASALETAVWWTEYIARGNGQPFLRSAAANLSWFQYHLLDVIGFLSLVTLSALFLVVFVIKRLLKTLCGKKKGGATKTNSAKKTKIDKKKKV